ncbi:MAG: 1-acyl-sn-glycerol-3-phosphate acyltransferase [Cyclobacteriaceae bacterium]|nr:1-acyl-sn-glycerol-3-phosphate acyltransferase [Cyclobacteriaceae bacterium]
MKGTYKVFHAIGLFILKMWVTIAIRAYFRKIRVRGIEKIPTDAPVIFAPNHQYAFMDAMVVATVNKRIPYFLVRADIFQTPLANFMLRALRMMPVYRLRDKVDVMAKNEDIFNKCVEILLKRKHLIIFPEGNHSKIRRIRTIRKGIMRIAFRAIKEDDSIDDLVIIPVGINYDNHSKFQSDLFIQFGDPIRVRDYKNSYHNNQSKTFSDMAARIYQSLTRLTVNINNADSYKFYENVLKIYTPHFMRKLRMSYKNLIERFNAYKRIITGMDHISNAGRDEFKRFEAANNRFFKQRLKSNFDPVYLGRHFDSRLQKFKNYAGLLLFWPIYIYGLVNNLPALFLPYIISKFTVRDDHWDSSVKLAIGLLSFPLCYTIQSLIFYRFFPDGWLVLLYLLSIIITGILAKIYQEWIHRFWESFKIWILRTSKKRDYVRIRNSYNQLIQKLDSSLLKVPEKADGLEQE